MPQIEIPFTPGQRVRLNGSTYQSSIKWVTLFADGSPPEFTLENGKEYLRSELTLVEPVIEWERNGPDTGWLSEDRVWYADDKGTLTWETHIVGTFPNPRAIAEATQETWNEARKGDTNG